MNWDHRLRFVCMYRGNTCRKPHGAALLRALASDKRGGINIMVSSAGIAGGGRSRYAEAARPSSGEKLGSVRPPIPRRVTAEDAPRRYNCNHGPSHALALNRWGGRRTDPRGRCPSLRGGLAVASSAC